MDAERIKQIANNTTQKTQDDWASQALILASTLTQNEKLNNSMTGFSENPNKQKFWDEIQKLNPDLASQQFKEDTIQGHFTDWTLKTMPPCQAKQLQGMIGFAYYSPSGMVRLTNYNLGNRGKIKGKKYHIDLASKPGTFSTDYSTLIKTDDEYEAFRQALLLEVAQLRAINERKVIKNLT